MLVVRKMSLLRLLIGLPLLRTLLLIIAYHLGHEVAEFVGRSYQGDYAWGITIQLSTIIFGVISLIEGGIVFKTSLRLWQTGLVFTVLFGAWTGLFIGYTGTWSHPYRLAYFQLCVLAAIWLPTMISGVASRYRKAPSQTPATKCS